MPDLTSRAAHGCLRLSFVVVADTHVNGAEYTSTSPYETNHLANFRARYVFAEMAVHRSSSGHETAPPWHSSHKPTCARP